MWNKLDSFFQSLDFMTSCSCLKVTRKYLIKSKLRMKIFHNLFNQKTFFLLQISFVLSCTNFGLIRLSNQSYWKCSKIQFLCEFITFFIHRLAGIISSLWNVQMGFFSAWDKNRLRKKIHQTFYFQMCHSNTSIRPPTHCTFWLKQTTGNKQTNKLCLRLRSKKIIKKSNFSDYPKKKRKTSSVCHRNPFTHLQQKPRIT